MIGLVVDFIAGSTVLLTRLVTAVRADWAGCGPEPVQRIYFANHASHGDFILIWSVLPNAIRARTRPVAGADYWLKGRVRRFLAARVFRSVLIDRVARRGGEDSLVQMSRALDDGASLILFPEGTRNTSEAPLLALKSGLYHLACRHPAIELVPVWIANLNRVLPKGEVVPIPVLCTVTFGEPLTVKEGEARSDFLARAGAALMSLAEHSGRCAA